MRKLYQEHTANYPRLRTDMFFSDYENRYAFRGIMKEVNAFIEEFQLLRADLWQRFVAQFRQDADYDAGWRCEYWGKMMRGACFTYSCTRNPALYDILTASVRDILTTQDAQGRISSYAVSHELDGWDLWGRKYVLLGMQYFLEICADEALKAEIVACMTKQVDAIISRIGKGEGQKPITSATRHWRGLNSSSLLEPIVRLYAITGEKRFLDFATYIVSSGGTDIANIFDLAYEDHLYPYQYPTTKAYEMTSCFEGLLEYYRVTGIERYKTAVIRFANRVLESDFTIIGGCGCTHELFDHSAARQANTTNMRIMQETCVTVTLMKFFYQLNLLTGDPRYADALETSFYNAYLGALNTNHVIEPLIRREHPDWAMEALPFDSYSPLTAGTRGNGVGGLKCMSDHHYYGCCACIGSAGSGVAAKMALLSTENGFALNLYLDGEIISRTPRGNRVRFQLETAYPRAGTVDITISPEREEVFSLLLRVPAWSGKTRLAVNGVEMPARPGYVCVARRWKAGDRIELALDMTTRLIRPTPYGHDILMTKHIGQIDYMVPTYDEEDPLAKFHAALLRGPIVLAQDNRLGYSVDEPVEIRAEADGSVKALFKPRDTAPYPHMVEMEIPLADGRAMTVTDYASAGKTWTEESKMAAWMRTK